MAITIGTSWTEIDWWSDTLPTGYEVYWRVVAKLSSQSVANNTSRIDFKWQKRITGGSAWASDTHTYKVTGTDPKGSGHTASVSWAFGTVDSSSWTDVGGSDYWGDVRHKDDGTCSMTANVSGTRWNGNSFSGSYTLTWATIPRASVPTVSPNPATISSAGRTVTVTTNRKSSSFTHEITLTCGSWTATKTGVGASTTFDIPYSVIAQFSATSKTATCSISCVTKNGSTTIGTKTASLTLQIDSSYDKAVVGTITVQDTNSRTSAVTQDDSIYIANISTLEATIPLTVSGSYTELASATVTCGNRSQTYSLSGTSDTITFTFDKVNASSLTVKVKDKRGTEVSGTASWTLIQYQPLTATATVGRPSATGSVATGQLTGMAYGGNFGATQNSLTVVMEYKKHEDSTYSGAETDTIALSQSGYNQYSKAYTFNYSFDYQYQYDIRFTVSDLFSTATYTAQLMQGLPILSWDEEEVDVWGDLHIHDRENPTVWQDVMQGFDAVWEYDANKNLFAPILSSNTSNGITFTPQADGSVKVSGTSTGTAFSTYSTVHFKAGTYLLTGGKDGATTMICDSNGGYVGESANGGEFVFEVSSDADYRLYCAVAQGKTVNTTLYPMIRDARIASDVYVPWRASRIFIKEDITLTISSGYATLNYPTGVTNTAYFLPVIQPVYESSALLGWTGVLQKNSDTTCIIYVRQGTTTPANNTKIKFTAIWIHR